MKLEIKKPEIHNKNWGSESWLKNSKEENLCGKILNFKKDTKFSLHYHLKKWEFWYFLSKFELIYIDTETAKKHSILVSAGDIVEIPRGLPHQLIALEDGALFEVSTFHEESDSYRIEGGASQGVK